MKYLYVLSFFAGLFYSCKREVESQKKKDNFFYDKAFEYRDKGKPDSAFFYFNKAKDLFLQEKDSLGAGKCLVNMGIISTDKSDYFGAQELSLNALSYLNQKTEKERFYIHSNFNNLGIATQNLGDYQRALEFYNSAIQFSRDSLDTRLYLNNKAKTYQVMADYKAALKIYNEVLKGPSKNRKEYARALVNVASTKWLEDRTYNAVPEYLNALRIREEEKDLAGQNSSYSHLSDFYYNKLPDSALFYAQKMYEISKKMNSAEDKLRALHKLIKLSSSDETKGYFDIYKYLNDSLQNARNAAKNQFALIRYETEKHKADFLKAQADNVRKQNNILRQNFALGVLVLVLLFGYWWYRKRKRGLQQEKEIEVKNTEIKYVKKIHDRVANKVYQVMSEVENTTYLDRDSLLDNLEVLYNISRDISYENQELDVNENYAIQLSKMLKSYSSENIGVLLVGNEQYLWEMISTASQLEIFCIMQELMTNMKKHSKADTVVLKFKLSKNSVDISYYDNGVGMNKISKKNGLINTENRIKSIRGTITFDQTVNKGLEINIVCPFL